MLTDGRVGNTTDVVNHIKANNSQFTVHTIGVGSSVSTSLIVGCAEAGKGNYYFVNRDAEGLEATVIEALRKSYYPYYYLKNPTLECNGCVVFQSNNFNTCNLKLLHGNRQTYFAIINKMELDKLEGSFKLNLFNSDYNRDNCIELDLTTQSVEIEGSYLFKLIAHSRIKELITAGDKESAISTSIKYQIPCAYTSFYAAEKLEDLLVGKVEYKKIFKESEIGKTILYAKSTKLFFIYNYYISLNRMPNGDIRKRYIWMKDQNWGKFVLIKLLLFFLQS